VTYLGLTAVNNVQIEIRWIRIDYVVFSTIVKYIKFSVGYRRHCIIGNVTCKLNLHFNVKLFFN
jgi:Ni,Fe-hydrogenase III component G